MKNKGAAILLCFFLGGFGAHKFYLGQIGLGVLYLLFCWTLIPGIVAFFEFFMLIFTPDDEFNRRFNRGSQSQSYTSAKDSTSALSDLKQLYDSGVITAEEYEEKRKKLLKNL
ncbi:NINE protein [Pseudanabaena sp. FACHB-1277]|jgi:TM2 domain-containing membrane protein YozV|uniref:NINE protein n=1 Tax=Pseudanabaena cinerea FACHB-1277 TaxID=2949581 RepID=A0A926Z826_9CYAN|nr:NINE protein [Pseudanabaena cinerea]MBD2152405.1 NINE protein [Pseudanabaena cinerea FACHB-1277]